MTKDWPLPTYINRIEPIWSMMNAEAGVSGQPVVGLCHLATALLLDEGVRAALVRVEIPAGDEIRFSLTDARLERQTQETAEPPPEGTLLRLRPLSRSSSYVGDAVYECLEAVLRGNSLAGLMAHLKLLEYVLQDGEVRARLQRVVDVATLEGVLRKVLP